MTTFQKATRDDLREDAEALTQYAIDLNKAAAANDQEKIARALEWGRLLWNGVGRHSPDLQRPYSMRCEDQIEAAMSAAETLGARANAAR